MAELEHQQLHGGRSPPQPLDFTFPKRDFGKKTVVKRAFQPGWFKSWRWLHYDEANDIVLCHTCVQALDQRKVRSNLGDAAFLTKGYCNWKDATIAFRKHESSAFHKEAVEMMMTLPATTRNVGEMLSTLHTAEKAENRRFLLTILSNIKFLARQNCAIRGHSDTDSNFHQLLKLRSEDEPKLLDWLSR